MSVYPAQSPVLAALAAELLARPHVRLLLSLGQRIDPAAVEASRQCAAETSRQIPDEGLAGDVAYLEGLTHVQRAYRARR